MTRMGPLCLALLAGCNFAGLARAGGGDGDGDDAGNGDGDAGLDSSIDAPPGIDVSCQPLSPSGSPRSVNNATDLEVAVSQAKTDDVIEMNPGSYALDATLLIDTPGLHLRSASGDPADVVVSLDSGGAAIEVAADRVTVAAFTIHSAGNGVVVAGDLGTVRDTTIHRVVFEDVFGTAVFIDNDQAKNTRGENGEISCSTFRITDRTDSSCGLGVAGIIGDATVDWRVTRNLFVDLSCDLAGDTIAVQFRAGAEGTVVDRNRFDRPGIAVMFGDGGAGSGSACKPDGAGSAHLAGLACNNVVWDDGATKSNDEGFFVTGFASWAACQTSLVQNTVFTLDGAAATSSLEGRFTNSSTAIKNNVTDLPVMTRDGATVDAADNEEAAAVSLFSDAPGGDLSLAGAGPAGGDLSGEERVVTFCAVDFAGAPRDLSAPTAGAYEAP